jgi:adenosine deaminase CECR1
LSSFFIDVFSYPFSPVKQKGMMNQISDDTGDDDEADLLDTKSNLLDAKIAHAHSRYAAGRESLIQRVVTEDGVMERDEWEALLQATDMELTLSDDDMAALKARQENDIAAAAAKAKEDSPIDLDAIRGDSAKVEAFCAAMPRAALLHVHPSGTRDLATVKGLLEELDPIVDGSEILAEANNGVLTFLYPEEVDALMTLPVQLYSEFDAADKSIIEELFFLPTDPCCHDFKRFEALFSIADVLLEQDESKKQFVTDKTYLDFVLRAQSLGLSYIEFTKVQIPATRSKLDEFAELKAFIETNTDVKVNFVYAFVRTLPALLNKGWAQDLVDLVAELPEGALKGIDLLANEVGTPALETGQGIYASVLNARESGLIDLKSTMHSGELGDLRNVRDSMIMGAQRIGHGVLLQQDPVALEYARLESIGIVCSLVSNQLLQVHFPYSTHPFLNYLRLGLPVSLSTDDEGMFRTDISNECVIAVTNTDIQYSELAALSRNSVEQSFADDATKIDLMATLEDELESFESTWEDEEAV